MSRRDRKLAVTPMFVSPDLERRSQEALLSWPEENDPAARAVWHDKYGELLTEYRQAVEQAQKKQSERKIRRIRRWRRIVTAVVCVLLATGGIVYWVNRPSPDELQQQEVLQQDTACTTHYEQTHHLRLVDRQIDLLKNGEGGWVDLYPQSDEPAVIGNLNLSPSELQANNAGKAEVNNEEYVYDSALGIGDWGLLERRGGNLVLTLFSDLSGFGELPHTPLRVSITSTAIVQSEKLSSVCE